MHITLEMTDARSLRLISHYSNFQNGGWIPYHGNNWPLRGGKITIWEGGTRTAGFVAGARLQKIGYTYEG